MVSLKASTVTKGSLREAFADRSKPSRRSLADYESITIKPTDRPWPVSIGSCYGWASPPAALIGTHLFRYAHSQPEAALRSESMRHFKKIVEERSQGRIVF